MYFSIKVMKTRCTLLFLAIAFVFNARVNAQLLNFNTYSLEQGLPATGAYNFAIGPGGQLWIATDGGGVTAFNGEVFTHFTDQDGLPAQDIRCLTRDAQKRIWAGSAENGLYVFDGKWKPVSLDAVRPFGQIEALCSDSTGTVYMGTSVGVVVIDKFNAVLPEWNNKLPNSEVRDLHFQNDTLWIATDAGFARLVNGQLHTYRNFPLSERAVSISAAFRGGVWVGTANGLIRVSGNNFYPYKYNKALQVQRIRDVCETFDGTLWLATYNGVFRLRSDQDFYPEHITANNGLADNRVRSIFQDPSGSLWFATYMGGVSQLTNTAFEHYTPDPARKLSFSAIAESPGKGYCAGLFENGLVEIVEDSVRWLDKRAYSVRSISKPAKQVNWVTHSEGLSYIRNGRVVHPEWPDSLATAFFYHCSVLGNKLFVSHQNKILSRPADPNINAPFELEMAFEEPDIILDFDFTADSACWAITDRNIGVYRPRWGTRLFLLVEGEELEAAEFTDLVTDSFGQIWVASMNRGVFRLSDGHISRLHSGNGLQSDRVHQLLFDEVENLWIGGLRGLEQVVMTTGNVLVERVNTFSNADGMRSMHTNLRASFKDRTNRLWFGTINGISNYSEARKVSVPVAPETGITGVDLYFDPNTDWKKYCDSLSGMARLPVNPELLHSQNHLTFHYYGISLANQQSVRYQYKLEGFDDWSPITANTTATYANIPPGTYTFKVIARSDSGIWNTEAAEFSFVVLQPFYATWWFILACLLVLALVVWAVLRWREQRFEYTRRRLEREVAERTSELQKEMKKSDDLLLNILPAAAARELKEKGFADARQHRNVSVLFTDFVDFTKLAERLDSSELVATLDECFRAFDEIIERHGLEKIKTIGDAYMCAAGLQDRDEQHAAKAVQVGIEMQEFMREFNAKREQSGKPQWKLRVGIHSGPVVAGIVGQKKFAYDIWGDTVNLASRIESSGEAGKINISSETEQLIRNQFKTENRGKIKVKNKGEVEMYFVENLK